MSICGKIKNSFIYTPGEGSTYCCEEEDYALPFRTRFSMHQWEEKRHYELSEFEKSKTNWLPQCYKCKINEEHLGYSMRTQSDTYSDNFIHDVVIKTNNTCNLACRMCSPNASTKWQSILANSPQVVKSDAVPISISDKEFELFKELVLTRHLKSMIISGGESLLSDYNKQAIDYLIEKNFAKNVILHITTNGTINFRDSWLDATKKFRRVIIEFSIDGTFDSFEYIREGHTWEKLCNVVQDLYHLAPNVQFKFNYVAQTLNASTLLGDALILWRLFSGKDTYINTHRITATEFLKRQISLCLQPSYLGYKSLSPDLREKYNLYSFFPDIDKLYPYSYTEFKMFMKQMGHMDLATGKSLKDFNPDFFNKKYYERQHIDSYYKAREQKEWRTNASDE